MLLPFLLVSLVSVVKGQITWLTAVSGNWNTGANWVGGSVPLLGQLATEIILPGTYTVTVDVNVALTGTGSLTIGSDLVANVNPTLSISAGMKPFFASLTVQNGGSIVLNNGAELWVTNLAFTSASAASVVSGTGKIYVNGTLTYEASNGILVLPCQVNTTGVKVGNGATLQLNSGGGCGAAGSINLGSTGGGGNVVVTSNFDLGNCMVSGSGNLTLNSSSTQVYVLAQGSHSAGYIKVQGNSQLSLSAGATTISGTLWIGGTGGRLMVQQSSVGTNTQVSGDVIIVAQGTYSVAINSNFAVTGTLMVGSDTTTGVAPTLTVASTVWVTPASLSLAAGGNLVLNANGGVLAGAVMVTGSSASTNTISGSGWLNVSTSFAASTNGATVQVNSGFVLTGSLSITNNHTVVVNSNMGWSSGSINLGAVGNGGNLVIQGMWSHSQAPSGGGGSITFKPSVSASYALVAGTYSVAWVKAQGMAHLWVSAATSTAISGSVWIQDSAKVTVNQTLSISQAITVAGSGVIEVAGANVMATTATFQSSSKYILYASTANPPKLTVSGQATFSGSIHIVSQLLVDGTSNVTVCTYASRSGTFGSVSAAASGMIGMEFHPIYVTSRRLLANNAYAVNYGSSSADAYGYHGNGASNFSPSILLIGVAFMMHFLLH